MKEKLIFVRYLKGRFIIAALTFLIGVAATTIWFIYRSPVVHEPIVKSAPPDTPVAFCDLIENADHYSSKIVRVQAILVGYHELALYNPTCKSEQKYLPAAFDPASRQKLIGAIATLNGLGFQHGNFWASVVLVGRFEEIRDEDARSGTTVSERVNNQLIKYHFRLAVLDLKHVEPVAPEFSWPQ